MLTLLIDLSQARGLRQEQILLLAKCLEQSEFFSPLICCPPHSFLAEEAEKAGLSVFSIKADAPFSLGTRFRLWLRQRKEQKIFIQAFGSRASILGHIVRKMRKPESAILVQSFFSDISSMPSVKSGYFSLADRITCGSGHILNKAASLGIDPSHMTVIRPGLAAPESALAYVKSGDRFIFAAMGALCKNRGYSVLIKAMGALWQRPDLPPWEVRIFGSGQLFQAILDEAVSLGVESRLALLGDQDPAMVLPLCDAMIVPGDDSCNAPGSINLGWLFGLPVICANMPQNLELARNDENVMTVTHEDPQILASAMIRLIQHSDLRHDLIDGGWRMLPLISEKSMCEGFIKLYSGLVAGRGWVLPHKNTKKAQVDHPAGDEPEQPETSL